MYEIKTTIRFNKDVKVLIKQGKDMEQLWEVVQQLSNGKTLHEKYKLHSLLGEYRGFKECHIEPDWLLIFYQDNNKLILTLTRTGSHSNLF